MRCICQENAIVKCHVARSDNVYIFKNATQLNDIPLYRYIYIYMYKMKLHILPVLTYTSGGHGNMRLFSTRRLACGLLQLFVVTSENSSSPSLLPLLNFKTLSSQ